MGRQSRKLWLGE